MSRSGDLLEGIPMGAEATIEQRSADVEAAIGEIRRKLEPEPPSPNWLDQVIGSLRDEPAFDVVLKLGRQIRTADRPGR